MRLPLILCVYICWIFCSTKVGVRESVWQYYCYRLIHVLFYFGSLIKAAAAACRLVGTSGWILGFTFFKVNNELSLYLFSHTTLYFLLFTALNHQIKSNISFKWFPFFLKIKNNLNEININISLKSRNIFLKNL